MPPRYPLLDRIYTKLLYAAGDSLVWCCRLLGRLTIDPIAWLLGVTIYRNAGFEKYPRPWPDSPDEKAP